MVWKNYGDSEKEKDEQRLVADCLKGVDETTGPSDEAQLMGAQIVQFGHELISGMVGDDNLGNWFQDTAQNFPTAIAKYIYNVARQLNENSKEFQDDERFVQFRNGLIPFISKTRSHIATLNYDTLFYSAFNEEQEVDGETFQNCKRQPWKTDLSDGYRAAGFGRNHFERPPDNDFGFYLHLHGSPLFVEEDGQTKKLKRNELKDHTPQSARHIILSDGELKPHLIQRSDVLSLYWRMLDKAIDESEEIILFGYGGADKHLNRLIREKLSKPKYVIEWSGTQHLSTGNEVIEPQEVPADTFWQAELGENTTVKRADDILAFREWDDPSGFYPF